jgi:hypothetical protein
VANPSGVKYLQLAIPDILFPGDVATNIASYTGLGNGKTLIAQAQNRIPKVEAC